MAINMFSHTLNIYFLVVALCVSMCAGNSNMKSSCVETEKQTLLKLKAYFIDDSGILSSWKYEADCCTWNGISCNYLTGHVTKLQVPSNDSIYLKGKIDSSLCDLHHLTKLNLAFNYFVESEIPKCIGSLNQLRELNLSYAGLRGVIPHELRNLSDLQTLDLGSNYALIVNDLEWLSNLSSLRHLDLSRVNLSKAIDWQSSLSKKALQLRELILADTYLVGVIPHQLGNLSKLETLDLSENDNLIVNNLKWISQLPSLRHLVLSQVNLSQAIDYHSSLSRKALQLRELILSDTYLVGVIPHQLGNLSKLETLDLSENDNLIVNDLKWISQFPSLRHLDLSWVNLSQAHDWHSSLSTISSLLGLNLDGCTLPQVNIKSLLHSNYSTSLTSLSLEHNDLDNSVLYWVSNISKTLVEIHLSFNSFQHIPGGAFSNMNSLKSLDLSSTSLQYVASDAFTNTTALESLYLFDNHLDSDVGKAISNLCRLRELRLSSNNLSGPLSVWITQLYCAQPSIEILDLSNNPFHSGPFPYFSKFSYLDSLVLRNTSLNGPIPQSLGYPPHLSLLDLSHNNLSGPFPKLLELSSLEYLNTHDNKLDGVVNEGHLSTLSNLRELDVSDNFLSFNFSPKWVPPFQLLIFMASSCNFSVGFPMWLKHQRELEELDISSGSISDSTPEWIWLLPSLSYLNISHNRIHGELSRSLRKSAVNFLDLSFNNLSGPIPQFSPQILVLLLSNNRFSGSTSSLCATLQSQLGYLDMSSNSLTGKLPHCWRQFMFLKVLILANNNFTGEIPSSIGVLKNIETIHLNNNNFSGEIPILMDSPYLKFIDYGQNNLHRKLPPWIGHYLPELIVLRLQANKLHGNIPRSLCKLSHLQILDISQNNISGTIPHCFNNLSALSNLTSPRYTISYSFVSSEFWDAHFIENAMLNWKGKYVKYDKNLGLMTAIDLSGNHLIGEIPNSITSLVALASLNLSRNNLTRFIPKNMGQMKMLESLDLSSNSLSGGIPKSFSNLNFLSFLNLSFNNLSGEIPQTTQLQTFEASSYIGNHGLCGPPLTKGCPKIDEFDQNLDIDANERDELLTFEFYVSMIIGFLVGFWGVCGTLILKSSWRVAYFQLFTNMHDWIYVHLTIFKARMKRRFQD